MSDQERWQVVGDAASTYERALVPALFAAWAPLVVALGAPSRVSGYWTSRAAPEWSRVSPGGGSGPRERWSAST